MRTCNFLKSESVFDTGHPSLPWRLLHDSQSKERKNNNKTRKR